MTHAHVFVALCIAWAISQSWIGLRRSGDKRKARDHGTLNILLIVIAASMALALWLALRDDGQLAARDARIAWSGMAVMLAGMALRWWSVRTLARYFTVDIAIHPGQTLIRRGPYRLLRHPSYTGALMTVAGFGLGTGAWLPALVAFVPAALAFLHRINVEERMLADAFPDAWPDYAGTTKRLIPYLW
jgi:protein-S-isoprenylcysteine O-methyltransferase